MIAIVDYGAGNIYSVKNAFEKIGAKVEVVSKAEDIAGADALVVPGVGSFDKTMEGLAPFKDRVFAAIESGIPYLGICMGLQALFDGSEEGRKKGLGLIPGKVVRLPDSVLVPQMGWNNLSIKKKTWLLEGIEDGDFFYFVHSYHGVPEDKKTIAATVEHGTSVLAALEKKNLSAVQFHPEKSGEKGLRILKNFVGQVKC